MANDPFDARKTLTTDSGDVELYSLKTLDEKTDGDVFSLPFSIRVMLESLLRNAGGKFVSEKDVEDLASWPESIGGELAYLPARVVMQDFTGVPAVVDLAAMRSAMQSVGGDPGKINPLVPTDLVIDHSVQVDAFGSPAALQFNAEREFERNRERYEFLKWGQQAFDNFSVVPPATGIIHQVNLEYLAKGVIVKDGVAMPDTLVGTDSHTTMINGLGVLGWGVGGIEAEAVTLGQPYYMLVPEVIGFKLTGALQEGVTATDLVLTVTQILRSHGVVGKFVEFYGEGLSKLSLPDRATIANMSPEFGATCTFFPVDAETLHYLRGTGRDEELIGLVEAYSKEQGLWRTDETPEPRFSETLELDLTSVEASLAGPRRPQDRVALDDMQPSFRQALAEMVRCHERGGRRSDLGGRAGERQGGGGARGFDHRDGRWRGAQPRARLGGDRRHNELHQHLQPLGDDGRRPAGEEGCGEGANRRPARQDQPRAGLQGRNGVPADLGAAGSPGAVEVRRGRDTGARPASATRGRWRRRSPPPSRRTTWSWPPCSRETGTSRAASTPTCAPTTWPPRRSSWPTPWPARWI
jgi:aconitase A